MRVAAVVTGVFLSWGGSSLRAAEAAPAASLSPANLSPFVAADAVPMAGDAAVVAMAGARVNRTLAPAMVSSPGGNLATSIGVETGEPLAANATDGVAAIPLPPSAYPGMVGLATAALSVWRYRRRRR
jgi:hypothetical protein